MALRILEQEQIVLLYNHFLYQTAFHHHLMGASGAFQAEVCADAQHFPFVCARLSAGMRFFQLNYFSYIYFHNTKDYSFPPCPYFFKMFWILAEGFRRSEMEAS